MHKRYSSNCALWPEQARRRTAFPLITGIAGMAIGIACAVAVYIVTANFSGSVATTQGALERIAADVPAYLTTAAPAITAAKRVRSSRMAAKVTLPIIGTSTMTHSGTDGHGGDTLVEESSVTKLTEPPASNPLTVIEQAKAADKPSAEVAKRKAKLSIRDRHLAKVHPHRTVRKKRERPRMYASRRRNVPSYYHGYGGHATYAYGGYGPVYAWPQW